MKDLPEQIEAQNAAYVAMTSEELAALPEDELFPAAQSRVEVRLSSNDFAALSHPQQVFEIVNTLEMEVNNGGLCQFFVNSSREYAPYVSVSLEEIGAYAHMELYDSFIHRCGIDLKELSSFQIHNVKEYKAQTERYPFDEFDSAFYDLPSLEDNLTRYIRSNISSF